MSHKYKNRFLFLFLNATFLCRYDYVDAKANMKNGNSGQQGQGPQGQRRLSEEMMMLQSVMTRDLSTQPILPRDVSTLTTLSNNVEQSDPTKRATLAQHEEDFESEEEEEEEHNIRKANGS